MLITNTEDRLDLANMTSFFHDNVVVLEIDNILSGWPTYTLDFMAEHPGPLKIILCLKDAVEFRVIEDEDTDDKADRQGNSIPQSVTKEDPDATMVCEPTPAPKNSEMPQRISAKPVQLHVVPKDSYTWPPRRGFRESSNCTRITQIEALMTIPAAIEALKLD
ncbi:hypothetical protein DFH29DRAFT_884171 [Suillus ampliporus]|nr:hypothetical protein DFH29DRAFT_884171 [Suillus ampliporus]